MADVTGPISSLPGATHTAPEGTMCDDHPDRPASHRVQGETDSFGSEMHDMCAECFKQYKDNKKPMIATCDWCKSPDVALKPRRDYDEGLAGRVYYVCAECIRKDNERAREEYEADREYYGED